VGRQAELDALHRLLARAAGGTGQLVTLTGEAGAGKTTLARRLADEAGSDGLDVAWGAGWPDGGAPPLWPWPTILAQLGLPAIDGAARRLDRFDTVEAALRTARAPFLAVLDDLNWADSDAVSLTAFVARCLPSLPGLLLVTWRQPEPGRAGDVEAQLARVGRSGDRITLGPLTVTDVRALIQRFDSPLDPRETHRRSGGNPLFVTELLRLAPGAAPPPDLAALVLDRAGHLEPAAMDVLMRAAVLGPEVDVYLLARVIGVAVPQVLASAEQAAAAGLVEALSAAGTTRFCHDVVREVLAASVTPTARAEVHRSAAEELSALPSPTVAEAVGRAEHGLRGAVDELSALRAVGYTREAAKRLRDAGAYEAAAELLGRAAELHRRLAPGAPTTDILVEVAEAAQRAGNLTASRRWWDLAATAAEREGQPESLADAALGLGGIWVHEHRVAAERDRVARLQRSALAGLPPWSEVRRARLRARLAAEQAYVGGSLDELHAAIDELRGLDDHHALAEGLNVLHHCLLGPTHARGRLAIADELVAESALAGDELLGFVAEVWRTVDLQLVGDPAGDGALARLADRLDPIGPAALRYCAAAMAVMGAFRDGDILGAEAGAAQTMALGQAIGDADALGWYGAQILAIRWVQARTPELLPLLGELVRSPTVADGEPTYRAAFAGVAAEAGRRAEAQAAARSVVDAGLANFPQRSTRLVRAFALAEAAWHLGDPVVAAAVVDDLAGLEHLPVRPSFAVTCLGPARRVVGRALDALGDLDGAIATLEEAVGDTRALRNRPMLAVTLAELADALTRRGRPGDHAGASAAGEEAAVLAAELGLPARRLDPAARGERPPGAVPAPAASMRREGGWWVIEVGSARAKTRDLVGVRHLAVLLANPHQSIAASALATTHAQPELVVQPLVDTTALEAYRGRVAELAGELDAAEADADLGRAERARAELDGLLDELGRVSGLSGRTRNFPDPAERARTAVRKAIVRATREIAASDPSIAALVERTVSTGHTCTYEPGPGDPVRFSVQR